MLASRKYYSSIAGSLTSLCLFLGSFIILGISLSGALVGPQFLSANAGLVVPGSAFSLRLVRASFILACIALSLLIIGYVLATHAFADMESKMYRDFVMRKRGYVGAHVETPTIEFIMAVICTGLGVATIIAAVLTSIASAVHDNNGTFATCAVILGFAVIVAALLTIAFQFARRETINYGLPNDGSYSGPAMAAPYSVPSAGSPGIPVQSALP